MTTDRLREHQNRGLKRAAGFTLIELLIIMVILGILAAIVMFAVQNLEGSSSVSSCKADFKTVETAQEAYRSQVGTSATTFDQLTHAGISPTGQAVGPWVKEAPTSKDGYQIGFYAAVAPTSPIYGDITVTATNPPVHGPDLGNVDCAYA